MDEKKNDRFERVCDNVFRKYPVLTVARLTDIINDAATDTQAAVLLENQGNNKEAAKAAALSIVKAPITAVAGIALATTQVVVGGVVLPVALARMAIEKVETAYQEANQDTAATLATK